MLPEDFLVLPKDFSVLPEDFLELPEDFSELPKDFLGLPKDFSMLPKDFLGLPKDFSMLPEDFLMLPKDFLELPEDFSWPLKVLQQPRIVSSEILFLHESINGKIGAELAFHLDGHSISFPKLWVDNINESDYN